MISLEHVTSAERGKILGHSNEKVFQNSYLSSHSGIDLQSLTHGQEQRKQQINFARSLGANRGPPFGLVTKETMEDINKEPQVVAAIKQVAVVETKCCARETRLARRHLFDQRRQAAIMNTSGMTFEPLVESKFMPSLRATIVEMLYGKEDDLPPRSDLVRNLQTLCRSMGKNISKYQCQNTDCRSYRFKPFRSQWDLIRHNEESCGGSKGCTIDMNTDSSDGSSDGASDNTPGGLLFSAGDNFCPRSDCPRHIKPLCSKKSLKAHMNTHANQKALLCPRFNC